MKPILFNTEMVRAILGKRKTVTRRVVKPPALYRLVIGEKGEILGSYDPDISDEVYPTVDDAPYQTGDILYVRETWATWSRTEGLAPKLYYKADGGAPGGIKWRPSIHMPKEAARLFLRVMDVRVERLQDITIEDAIKEGCSGVPCDCSDTFIAGGTLCCVDCMNTGWVEPPTVEFLELWDRSIKKADLPRYGWAANPWVWAIEFAQCEKPEGE